MKIIILLLYSALFVFSVSLQLQKITIIFYCEEIVLCSLKLDLKEPEILKGFFNGAMTQWLRRWIPNPGVPCSKPLGGSKVDLALHPSEVDKMGTRNFWELNDKK